MPNRLSLSDEEKRLIQARLTEMVSKYRFGEDGEFLKDASILAHDLPLRVRRFINDFKVLEPPSGVCLISGYPVDDSKIGRTPAHWKSKPESSHTLEMEILLVLFGSLLGEVFGWGTQQDGHILHEVLPIKDYEDAQLGTSSSQTLWWHSEDAFHPYRGDYLGLMCLRNPDRVATTFASVDMLELSAAHIEILCEPRFIILPDESHQERKSSQKPSDGTDNLIEAAYRRIDEMNSHPKRVPLLFGPPQSPYLCLDSVYMETAGEDEEAEAALRALVQSVNANLQELVLQPGDYCFIDNYRTVHGRKSFQARYDGTDRWLKRINITRDLRKSRSARTSCESRIIM
jgi:Fe(II)/alpha-ketoglutarate-dependent arginine beta-hydroxylase